MLIVFEGVDGCGKKTQALKLVKNLKRAGYSATYHSYPAYNTWTGMLIWDYIRGKFGDPEDLPREARVLLYALDRYANLNSLMEKLSTYDAVVCDRYWYSNLAYQGGNGLDDWIEAVESRLPRSDVVIYLDIDPKLAEKLEKRSRDPLEYNLKLQNKARRQYIELAERNGWITIHVTDESGNIRDPCEIEREVWEIVSKKLIRPA